MSVASDYIAETACTSLREARLKLESFGIKDADTPEHLFNLRWRLESAISRYQEAATKQTEAEFLAVLRDIEELH